VNTEVEPPLTTWNHPLGPVSPPPPERKTYSPPAAPANNSSTYASGYGPATGQGDYPSQGGGNGYPQPFGGAEYERDYSQQNVNNRLGGLLGRLTGGERPGYHHDSGFGHEGRFGGGGGGYAGQQQQPQVLRVEQQQASKRSGMGKIVLAAGAGLLGGGLLAEALGNRNDDRYDDCDGGDNRGYDDYCGDRDDGGDFF